MSPQPQSPPITHLSWGKLEVEGYPAFKDAKLFPGGARVWDWSETGTHHLPGIQMADIEELLVKGAHVIVLSRGMHLRLQTPAETLKALDQRGIKVHVLETNRAVEYYNRLQATEKVGGLIHSTC